MFCPSVRQSQPRAFSLVELLVVIAIIGVLLALLLPAVQAAREAARSAQCSNNLRQFGIGLHNYHAAHQCFPRGGAGAASLTNAAVRAKWTLSWGAAILPGLEQQALYDRIDQNQPYLAGSNLTPGRTVLPVFLCPSSPCEEPLRPNGDTPYSTTKYARSDYGGNWGERSLRCYPNTNCPNNYGNGDSFGRGVLLFSSEPQISMNEITDGSTQTIMVGEGPDAMHGIWIGHKDVWDQSAPLDAQVSTKPTWPSCDMSLQSLYGNACDYGQEYHSYHPGGAHFLFVDGSVYLLANTLDIKVLAALLSRKGGEVIDANSY